ncbi:MAG TPA: NTPase [Dehalococcoidia bacterium]|nr:NTPase [Dehalococcoidia bacterium]
MKKSNIERTACLLTGGPGVGKTTIIKQALDRTHIKAGGFFTEEIRESRARQGFRLVTLDGESAILAHTGIKSPYRVSKYGVDIDGLDRVGVAALREAARECDVVVIDEIGKMELFSPDFKEAVLESVNSDKRVLGTIMLSSHPWANQIRQNPNVVIITVTRTNHRKVLEQVIQWLDSTINDS